MTPELAARLRCERAELQYRHATAALLLRVARDGVRLSDLIQFAAALDVHTTADTLAAFRSAQREELEAASAALARLK